MKTRRSSLPLVILAALFYGSIMYAQPAARFQLISYLEKIPKAPAFPDSSVLASTKPTSFEDNSDLNSTIKTLQDIARNIKADDAKLAKASTSSSINAEPADIKHAVDTLQFALKELQAIKTEYAANFRRLENLYDKRVDDAMVAMRKLQTEHPCKGNMDCELEHVRAKNKDLIAATREKILNEQYLLFVYMGQARSSFKLVDKLLSDANYGDRAVSQEAKTVFWGAQQNQIQLLTDIIERLKLERITISNCARMAQEGRARQ